MNAALPWIARLTVFVLMYFGTGQLMDGSLPLGVGLMVLAGGVGMFMIKRFGRL